MSENANAVLSFVSDHQLIIIPVLTLIAGIWSSLLIRKAKRDDVKLNGRVKLADLRKENYDELKFGIDELYEQLTLLINERPNFEQRAGMIVDIKEFAKLLGLRQKISMRIRANTNHVKELDRTFALVAQGLLSAPNQGIKSDAFEALSGVLRSILTAEWDAMENELKHLS